MDEFLERLNELDLDESDGMLMSAHLVGQDDLALCVLLKGHTWSGDEMDKRWQMITAKVAEHRLKLSRVDPTLEMDYPRLRERQEEWCSLCLQPLPYLKLNFSRICEPHTRKQSGECSGA